MWRFRLSRSFRRSLRHCLTSKRRAREFSLKDKGGMLVCMSVSIGYVGRVFGGW